MILSMSVSESSISEHPEHKHTEHIYLTCQYLVLNFSRAGQNRRNPVIMRAEMQLLYIKF